MVNLKGVRYLYLYKEDSWDESEMAFDLGGNQRSPDEDAPEYYTLGSAGMIDARIENMEVFSLEDGSKDPQSSDEQVAGKMLFPNSGMRSPYWSEGPFLPFCPAPEGLIPDLLDGPSGNLGGGDKIKRPDWHPRPNPGEGAPDLSPPDIDPWFYIGGAMLMSSGYNNPNYGLPSDGGGAFIGMGRFDAACNIPNEMQPGIPPGGLFGPDAFIPDWGRPGYRPPSDTTSPFIPGYSAETMGAGIGAEIMPEYRDIDINEISSLFGGEFNLPGGAPSLNAPGFGMITSSFGEVMDDLYGHFRPVSEFGHPIFINIAPPPKSSGPQDEPTKNLDGTPRTHKPGADIPGHIYDPKTGGYTPNNTGHGINAETGERFKEGKAVGWETGVSRRTGLTSYAEKTQRIPSGIDRAAYFKGQLRGAQAEARKWLGIFVAGTIATVVAGATGLIGLGLRYAFGEAWYDSCLGFRRLGKGWSYGRRCKTIRGHSWDWRVDLEPEKGSKALHYHRRIIDPKTGEPVEGGGIGRHRPWDPPPEGKPWWWRFL